VVARRGLWLHWGVFNTSNANLNLSGDRAI
jgi:hypothetical protein